MKELVGWLFVSFVSDDHILSECVCFFRCLGHVYSVIFLLSSSRSGSRDGLPCPAIAPLPASPLPAGCNRIRFLLCATSSPQSQLVTRLSVRSSSAACYFVFCWRRLANCTGYVTSTKRSVNELRIGKGAAGRGIEQCFSPMGRVPQVTLVGRLGEISKTEINSANEKLPCSVNTNFSLTLHYDFFFC
jgi:hypothetical protein